MVPAESLIRTPGRWVIEQQLPPPPPPPQWSGCDSIHYTGRLLWPWWEVLLFWGLQNTFRSKPMRSLIPDRVENVLPRLKCSSWAQPKDDIFRKVWEESCGCYWVTVEWKCGAWLFKELCATVWKCHIAREQRRNRKLSTCYQHRKIVTQSQTMGLSLLPGWQKQEALSQINRMLLRAMAH